MSGPGQNKLLDLRDVVALRERWRRDERTVALATGGFDLLHPGHLALFSRARGLAHVLIVGVEGDGLVLARRGAGRPVTPAADRAMLVAALACVDAVFITEEQSVTSLIETLRPDVVVDAQGPVTAANVSADDVSRLGSRLVLVPLLPGYSTSHLIARAADALVRSRAQADPRLSGLVDSIRVKDRLLAECGDSIIKTGQLLVRTLVGGRRVFLFGNGGSAAEAQHIAAELVGRFQRERPPLPAIALTTDTSALTAIGNDYGFEHVFARQVEALAQPGDAVIALSTSGASPNVLAGVAAARRKACVVIGVTGIRGHALARLCDGAVVVPSGITSRIQEASLTIGHLWCEMVDRALADHPGP